MNFDDIKSAWDNESGNEMEIPKSVKLLKQAQHPLTRIRRNMRNEFYAQLAAMVYFGFLPQIYQMNAKLYLTFYLLYAFMVAISIYYLVKFYNFFQHTSNIDLNTKDSLYELYYDLSLNMEMYKSFTFIITPFAIAIMLLASYEGSDIAYNISTDGLSSITILPLTLTTIFIIVFIVYGTRWWVNHFYGAYGRVLKALIDEMKEE